LTPLLDIVSNALTLRLPFNWLPCVSLFGRLVSNVAAFEELLTPLLPYSDVMLSNLSMAFDFAALLIWVVNLEH